MAFIELRFKLSAVYSRFKLELSSIRSTEVYSQACFYDRP